MNHDPSKLIRDSLPIVERVAENFIRGLNPSVDADAVRGAAREALVRAACSVDPGYCHARVLGAMRDELRRLDPAHNRTGRARVELDVIPLDAEDAGQPIAEKVAGGGDLARSACARLDLRDALRRLPRKQRHALISTQLGRQAHEVAAELDTTTGYVHWLRHDAMRRCRQVMAA